MNPDSDISPSIHFIGSSSPFSVGAFKALCESHLNVTQLILAGYAPAEMPDTCFAVLSPVETNNPNTSIQQIAVQHGVPISFLGHPDNDQRQWENICTNSAEHAAPDYVFVACFPKRLPAIVLSWPRKACINLHPSLLPSYRGPDPIFWQLRNNETNTGFSLHIINNKFDAGPVLYQQAVAFHNGATNQELNSHLSQTGALAFVHALMSKRLTPTQQDSAQASYQPFPTDKDYLIETDWSVRHAYNFIHGTHTPAGGYPVVLRGSTYFLIEALSIHHHKNMAEEFIKQGDSLQIRLSDGVLLAKSV